jgi:hypothetical protein
MVRSVWKGDMFVKPLWRDQKKLFVITAVERGVVME